MKKLIVLGALVVVILSYVLGGFIGSAVGAVIVAAVVLSYRLAGGIGLARAMLPVTLILSFVIGGFAGRAGGPKPPGITMTEEIALFAIGGAIGLIVWLAVVLSAFALCSEIIFVSHGGDRWASFIYLVTSLLLERAGALEIVSRGEVRTIRARGMFARFRATGYTIVYHGNAVVFERFGRLSQVVGRGLVIKKPFEMIRAVVDLSMQVEERRQTLFTRDGIPLTIYVKVSFRIDSGRRAPTPDDMFPFSEPAVLNAVYLVPDWKAYTVETALALLRDMICTRYLDEIYAPLKRGSSKRAGPETHAQLLQDELQTSLSATAIAWGVKIERVEIGIAAPREIEDQALAFEKARKEEELEYQRSRAENRRIKEFISRTGANVTDYAMLRYLEKLGETGIVPPSLERMFLEATQREGTGPPKSEGSDRHKGDTNK
jgi:regulator of protease activity HflC (stomatin/prohibitin superfamily)